MCLEHLCRLAGGLPSELEVATKLQRVVCWDESLELWFRQERGKPPGVGSYVLLLVNNGYKPAIEVEVLSYSNAQLNSRL